MIALRNQECGLDMVPVTPAENLHKTMCSVGRHAVRVPKNNIHRHGPASSMLRSNGSWLPADLSLDAQTLAEDKFFCPKEFAPHKEGFDCSIEYTIKKFSVMNCSSVLPHEDVCAAVDRSKSSGLTFATFKTKGAVVDDPFANNILGLTYEQYKFCYETFNEACLKIEIRERLRVLAHKTRIFVSVCLSLVMMGVHLFGEQNDKLYHNLFESPCLAGMNVFFDWDKFVRSHLLSESRGNVTVLSDFSNLDNTIHKDWFCYVAYIRWYMYSPAERTDDLFSKIVGYYRNVSFGITIVRGWFCEKDGGQVSGSATTISDNSIIVTNIKYYCYILWYMEHISPYEDTDAWREKLYKWLDENVLCHTVGDDGADSQPSQISTDWMSEVILRDFGMTCNYESSTSILTGTFLSGNSRFDKRINKYVRLPDAEKVREGVCFFKGDKDTHKSRLQSALINSWVHPELFSELWVLYKKLYGASALTERQIQRIYTHYEALEEFEHLL